MQAWIGALLALYKLAIIDIEKNGKKHSTASIIVEFRFAIPAEANAGAMIEQII